MSQPFVRKVMVKVVWIIVNALVMANFTLFKKLGVCQQTFVRKVRALVIDKG